MSVQFKRAKLANGLTILGECDPQAHSAAVGYFVRTGARDEPAALMGVSHFLEHMMFKGTAELSAEAINRGFDDLGARNNAYTSHEITVFFAQVLPEHLAAATDLLGKMMRPALRSDDFESERGVILEEIAMYKDNPFWVLYEATMERHFKGHPLGFRVLGTEQTVGSMSPEQMRDYFAKRYGADNTVVALAGRLDFDRTVQQIDALCGSWESTGPGRDAARPAISGEQFELRDEQVARAYGLMLADAPSQSDDRRYAAALLAQILGGSDNSRLHWALIETGLAEEAQAAYDPHDGTGQFFVYASGDPARADEIWGIVEREIADLQETLCADDLLRLRAKHATSVTLGAERPSDRMQRLGRLWSGLGEYYSLEDELARINAVTLDDLHATLDAFAMTPRTVGWLMPAEATKS